MKDELDEAVGKDFIEKANALTGEGDMFFVGLSHGQSPTGAYQYILDNYNKIKHHKLIYYTFVNSPLKRQRGLEGFTTANVFLHKLYKRGLVERCQILGDRMDRSNLEVFSATLNKEVAAFLKKHHKTGLDYAILASDSNGQVAGITRSSEAFNSDEITTVVTHRTTAEVTITPSFLLKTKHIAFLATKADKRRPLAWLYYRWGQANQSPSFLRYIEDVENRLTVYVDEKALTWPQLTVTRNTPYGDTAIRVDMAKYYKPNAIKKLPVVLMVHGFLGLNTFDGLLTALPSHQYLAAAMHYGTIPDELPIEQYSQHIVLNIDATIKYFGELGHDVYLFDHSMANIYFLMMDRDFDELEGVNTYLKGRIGSNPFFGEEAKHATLGFMDNVLLPSLSYLTQPLEKTIFYTLRGVVPLDSKKGVRRRAINLTHFLINQDSKIRDRLWSDIKKRMVQLMSNLGSLPHLDRIPIMQALNKLPAKIPAIQIHSALEESKDFDFQQGLQNFPLHNIPVLILKSDKDIVARFVPRLYDDGHTEVLDITNEKEPELFREHLYFMISPLKTAKYITRFINEVEASKMNIPDKKGRSEVA